MIRMMVPYFKVKKFSSIEMPKGIKHVYKTTISLADIFDLAHMSALKESANQTPFSAVS